MSIYLSLNESLRTETDSSVISNLMRKGWQITEPPSYNSTIQHPPIWQNGDWVVLNKTLEELAADTRKIWPSTAEYILEFTFQEMSVINLSVDPTIAALRLLLACWNGEVWSDDPRVIAGLDALEAAQIINASRRQEILSF